MTMATGRPIRARPPAHQAFLLGGGGAVAVFVLALVAIVRLPRSPPPASVPSPSPPRAAEIAEAGAATLPSPTGAVAAEPSTRPQLVSPSWSRRAPAASVPSTESTEPRYE